MLGTALGLASALSALYSAFKGGGDSEFSDEQRSLYGTQAKLAELMLDQFKSRIDNENQYMPIALSAIFNNAAGHNNRGRDVLWGKGIFEPTLRGNNRPQMPFVTPDMYRQGSTATTSPEAPSSGDTPAAPVVQMAPEELQRLMMGSQALVPHTLPKIDDDPTKDYAALFGNSNLSFAARPQTDPTEEMLKLFAGSNPAFAARPQADPTEDYAALFGGSNPAFAARPQADPTEDYAALFGGSNPAFAARPQADPTEEMLKLFAGSNLTQPQRPRLNPGDPSEYARTQGDIPFAPIQQQEGMPDGVLNQINYINDLILLSFINGKPEFRDAILAGGGSNLPPGLVVGTGGTLGFSAKYDPASSIVRDWINGILGYSGSGGEDGQFSSDAAERYGVSDPAEEVNILGQRKG